MCGVLEVAPCRQDAGHFCVMRDFFKSHPLGALLGSMILVIAHHLFARPAVMAWKLGT